MKNKPHPLGVKDACPASVCFLFPGQFYLFIYLFIYIFLTQEFVLLKIKVFASGTPVWSVLFIYLFIYLFILF